jgi:hypothetical protein
MRRAGLVDSEGLPTDPRRIVCLAGKKPAAVRQRLQELGFERVSGGLVVVDARGQLRTHSSEVYRYYDPDGRTAHYVRIDEFGHNGPPDRAGSVPHYHVDTCDRTQPASPDRRTGVVPTGANGQPLSQDQNYEQRYEPAAVTHDDSHNRVDQPNRPGATNPAPDMGTWAHETHLPVNQPNIIVP